MSVVKSTAVTDTDVSIECVNLALYDSYVVIGPHRRFLDAPISRHDRPGNASVELADANHAIVPVI